MNGLAIERWEIAALVQTALRSDPRNRLSNEFKPSSWQKPTAWCLTLANWYQVRIRFIYGLP